MSGRSDAFNLGREGILFERASAPPSACLDGMLFQSDIANGDEECRAVVAVSASSLP